MKAILETEDLVKYYGEGEIHSRSMNFLPFMV